jgi:selenocysteine lyase/cysteine desulfurase
MFEDKYPKFYDGVTKALGRYTGTDPQDLALTSNTTAGLSVVYHGLPLKPGDEVLTTDQDHYVQHEAIRLATERTGASWRKIPIFSSYDSISADDIVDRIRKGIGPKTRVVGITWVHSSIGLRMPVRRIADAIAELNADRGPENRILLVVDGVHGIGVEDPWITELGADVFAAGLHKLRITERIHALNTQMREGLSKMANVVVYTPASSELSAGLVCFDVKGLMAADTVGRLQSKKILASTTPYRVPLSRVACGIMNTPAEVESALRAIRSLG